MANTVSSIKRVRTTERRTEFNRQRRSRLKTAIKTFRKLLTEKKAAEALASLPRTYSAIDKAAKVGIIKRNTASRYKSRLTARVKALATA